MYAVVLIKGKQYRVEEGQEVSVDKMHSKEGSNITFDKVLAVKTTDKYLFGVEAANATIDVKVVEHFRDDKVEVQKYKKRKRYKRTLGHKQQLTRLKIEKINITGATKKTAAKKEEKEKKTPTATAKKTKTATKQTKKAPDKKKTISKKK